MKVACMETFFKKRTFGKFGGGILKNKFENLGILENIIFFKWH